MKAAYTAFKAGATASQAASSGANALIVGLDPTSIAISLAINFMIDFLFSGCDQQDMETAMLDSSGMCHFIGSYCTRSEEHTSELQSLMRISYAVFCLKKKKNSTRRKTK